MQKQTFKITGDYIELIKLLKASGLCAMGSDAKNVVSAAKVKVNGAIDLRLRAKIRVGDKIEFENTIVEVE